MTFAELRQRAQQRLAFFTHRVAVGDEEGVALGESQPALRTVGLRQARTEIVEQLTDFLDGAASGLRPVERLQQRWDSFGGDCGALVLCCRVHE